MGRRKLSRKNPSQQVFIVNKAKTNRDFLGRKIPEKSLIEEIFEKTANHSREGELLTAVMRELSNQTLGVRSQIHDAMAAEGKVDIEVSNEVTIRLRRQGGEIVHNGNVILEIETIGQAMMIGDIFNTWATGLAMSAVMHEEHCETCKSGEGH